MDEFIDVLHSFNGGDLITSMAGLKAISELKGKKVRIFQRIGLNGHYFEGQINSTVNGDGESVCMNERLFNLLKPLVESQPYIHSFEIFNGQKIHYNFDLTRDSKSVAMPAGTIHSWYMGVFPEMNSDPSKAWLQVPFDKNLFDEHKDKILINRTRRYTNPYINYYFLKEHQSRVLFSGTEAEYKSFCAEWDLKIDRIECDNFYELAQLIQVVKFGIFNQSCHFHISDSLKSKRILELCSVFPNTFITGANGCQFYHQAALEYYVSKMVAP